MSKSTVRPEPPVISPLIAISLVNQTTALSLNNLNDTSTVRSRVVGYFGNESLVQLSFNCDNESDWARHRSDLAQVVNSFRFSPSAAYTRPSRRGFLWDRLLVDLGIYGSIALVLLLTAVAARLFTQKKRRYRGSPANTKSKNADCD